MPSIVFDCCAISNFALSGSLSMINGIHRGASCITDFVSVEILKGIRAGHGGLTAIPEAVEAGWLTEVSLISRKEKTLFEALSISLGNGEASSLAVAACRGFLFASDDQAARREAGRLGVRLTGTVGILGKAVRLRICDIKAADRYLAKMIGHGFYAPVRSIKEVLQFSTKI
jgi:predicted nucleic acid-binding protein